MNPVIPITAIAAVAGTLTHGARSRTSQLFAPSINRGDPTLPNIALTFDDGPSESTPHLLDYLAEQQVPATFFQCGLNVQRLPAIARRVHADGHELGNHTWSHIRLCPRLGFKLNLRSPREIYSEIARTQDIMTETTGYTPTLFRAPYGLRWLGLREAQRRLELTGVLWTVIGRDWELPANQIAELIITKAVPGSILCLHDGRDIQPNPDLSEMLDALRVIVPRLKADGFQFRTVSQLVWPDA
jgi:peptidoglycan/xylan/chitin deacetylase (PgdA/CDA1 family)